MATEIAIGAPTTTFLPAIVQPALPSPGNSLIYFDILTDKIRVSQNGAPFQDLIAAAGTPALAAVLGSGNTTGNGTAIDFQSSGGADAFIVGASAGVVNLGATSGGTDGALATGSVRLSSNFQTTSLSGSPSATASVAYKLPPADGTAGQFLSTNGAGVLSWATGGSGSTPTFASVLAAGNTTGASSILVSAGQAVDSATAGGVLSLGTTNATGGVSIGVASSPISLLGATTAQSISSTQVGLRSNGRATVLVGSPSATASVTYALPPADGASGQFLSTSGAGVLSWASAPVSTQTLAQTLSLGNTTGANNLLVTAGQRIDAATLGGALNLGTTNATGGVSIGVAGSPISLLGNIPTLNFSNVNYTTPTSAPAANGYVLSSTTAGVMSWVPQSGGSTPTLAQVLTAGNATGSGVSVNYQGAGGSTFVGAGASSGSLKVGTTAGASDGSLALQEVVVTATRLSSNGRTTSLTGSPSASASVSYALPPADGTPGQFLSTNGSGTLSWATAGGGTQTLAQTLALGNTTGANNLLVTAGQRIDAAVLAGALNLGTTNATGGVNIGVASNPIALLGTTTAQALSATQLGVRSNGQTTNLAGSPSASASVNYVLPPADGTPGQFLSTNGSGVLSWTTGGGGGSQTLAQTLANGNGTGSGVSINYQSGGGSTFVTGTATGSLSVGTTAGASDGSLITNTVVVGGSTTVSAGVLSAVAALAVQSGSSSDLTLSGRGAGTTLNQSGQTSLNSAYTVAGRNSLIGALNSLVDGTIVPSGTAAVVQARRTTTFSASTTPTDVTLDTNDVVSNPSALNHTAGAAQITALVPGTFTFTYYVPGVAGSTLLARAFKNGSSVVPGSSSTTTGTGVDLFYSFSVTLAANDTVTLQASVGSGTATIPAGIVFGAALAAISTGISLQSAYTGGATITESAGLPVTITQTDGVTAGLVLNGNGSGIGGGIAIPGSGGATSLRLGPSTQAQGTNAIAVGSSANAQNNDSIAVGAGAVAGAFAGSSIAIGSNSNSVGSCIVIGTNANASSVGSNTFVVGSSTMSISNVYIGNGPYSNSPVAVTYHGVNGTQAGTNIAGGNLVFDGGTPSGDATQPGGEIVFQTAPVGTTSVQERLRVSSDGPLQFASVFAFPGPFPPVSPAGTARLYYDGNLGTLQVSLNGSAYSTLPTTLSLQAAYAGGNSINVASGQPVTVSYSAGGSDSAVAVSYTSGTGSGLALSQTTSHAQPALTVQRTNAGSQSTSIAAGSNGQTLPQASINVNSTTGFPAAGVAYVTTSAGQQTVTYTSIDATHLLGCSGGTGVMSTGGAVQAFGAAAVFSNAAGSGAVVAAYATGLPFASYGSGNKSQQFGEGSRATGDLSTAVGVSATAGGSASVAVGSGATASVTGAVAISTATASGTNSISVGHNSSALGTSSISIGDSGGASGNFGVSMGYQAFASFDYSIALGYQSNTFGTNSICVNATSSSVNAPANTGVLAGPNRWTLGNGSSSATPYSVVTIDGTHGTGSAVGTSVVVTSGTTTGGSTVSMRFDASTLTLKPKWSLSAELGYQFLSYGGDPLSNNGGSLSFTGGKGGGSGLSGNGGSVTIAGGPVDSSSTSGNGGSITISGGTSVGVTGGNGGDVSITGGAPGSGGTIGSVNIGTTGTATVTMGGASTPVNVVGSLSKGSGSFKIDHPLAPAEKYLYHSFVESPDMLNIYNGTVTADCNGEAWVELPEWFEALNMSFRYQLTCIGGWAPVFVKEKIKGNAFLIAGATPDLEVSWQVTGVRQDAYAQKNRIQVEVEKSEDERGLYLHPEAFGLSAEFAVTAKRVVKV